MAKAPPIKAPLVKACQDQAGYTIIELISAMAVMMLVLAFVGPGLMSGLNRAGLYAARIEFETAVRTLRRDAFLSQAPVTVVSSGAGGGVSVPLQDNWTYALARPLRIEASGVCVGGPVRIENKDGFGSDMQLLPPDCRLERLR